MKLAILETGKPPGDLAETHGSYPDMFRQLLGDGFEVSSFDVEAGALPLDPADFDAYLVTGSPAGVYDKLPWIAELSDFLRAAKSRKLVGICFGHQIMAEALGGHVEKSAKGWGAGLHTYPIVSHEPWMDGAHAVSVPASHQDQVVLQPPNTDVIASSVFTPYAGLAWRDRPAISFQFHPEFAPEYAKALIEARYDRVPDPEAAIASLDAPNDNARVGDWIRRFLLS
ncbi:MAG TPA: type 1 glutamine amidotransferase [Allosphingosinicella sp.]|jgi:GMP synthase-like glutamine amidotransferase